MADTQPAKNSNLNLHYTPNGEQVKITPRHTKQQPYVASRTGRGNYICAMGIASACFEQSAGVLRTGAYWNDICLFLQSIHGKDRQGRFDRMRLVMSRDCYPHQRH